MTPRRAAKIIGCSVQHVRTLIRGGKLKATKRVMFESDGKEYYQYNVNQKDVLRYAGKPQRVGYPRGRSRLL